MAQLAPDAAVADLGAEPIDAADWSRLFGCHTLAVDDDPDALAALEKESDETGLGALLTVVRGDPRKPEVPGLAARGAALIQARLLPEALGFERSAEGLRELLDIDGVLVLYARTWLCAEVPGPVRELWERRAHGPIRSVKETLALFPALGFEPMTCEVVAASAWDEHYAQSEARLAALASGAGLHTPLGEALEALREEIRVHHEAGGRATSSIGCFVGRRVEPDSPPRWPRRGASE
ncbi:MAG: hypothetical protein ACYCWW_06540 [Deltaproteobacteria bacterium]